MYFSAPTEGGFLGLAIGGVVSAMWFYHIHKEWRGRGINFRRAIISAMLLAVFAVAVTNVIEDHLIPFIGAYWDFVILPPLLEEPFKLVVTVGEHRFDRKLRFDLERFAVLFGFSFSIVEAILDLYNIFLAVRDWPVIVAFTIARISPMHGVTSYLGITALKKNRKPVTRVALFGSALLIHLAFNYVGWGVVSLSFIMIEWALLAVPFVWITRRLAYRK